MQHYFNPMSRGVTTHWMLLELEAEHEAVVVTEVAAICTYLADKFTDKNMAPPLNSNLRGKYYRYLFFPGTTLEPMFTARQLGLDDDSPASTGWGDYDRCLASIEAMTPANAWVLGEDFSAADVVFAGNLDFAVKFGWLVDPSAKVADYVARLKARPAYRASHDESWL